MILKETLRRIVTEQRQQIVLRQKSTKREILDEIPLDLPYAVIISGVRRVGKSTLLQQLFTKLPDFYYFNFEDPRLIDFELGDFDKLNQVMIEEYGQSRFYMLDEIQNIKGWEVFVRSMLDKGKQFFITGSNASLLSRELGTRLTGRHINIELFPFSFPESLNFFHKDRSLKAFEEYFQKGGLPQYLRYNRIEILQDLLLDVLYRDIVSRHNIRDSKSLQELALYLLGNVSNEYSYNNLKKLFNFGSVNTPISYISYMEDSYLLFTVQKFDYSLKKQTVNEKKVYGIDNGLIFCNSTSLSSDRGRMLENMVFLNLRRKYNDIYYFKEKKECDFIVMEKKKIIMAIQVCYEITDDNKSREIEGLMEAMTFFNLDRGLILTYDQEDVIHVGQKYIDIKPVWRWL
ncbi:ATP-binding protein [Cuniculiplasma divulgatum]|uniref:Predicted ATPase (AAA+ superfamily) n=1 Tax=Cuniculiplasma divulgatum TaxID=1673428 RepID=A0A1R4A777_9ARCH|nr:ATP-binding protein [Cuniculiplasma divulgatum]MCI2411928.1 ATP-binding protein [Cuniculiplasma sp.]WMT49118.1 MAG: ATP-binding protein [Thermoplasmatales archaeon]SJK84828.1 predicted ATPase (AAA+ superfamily) [Cuniculiplasma divulgatum]